MEHQEEDVVHRTIVWTCRYTLLEPQVQLLYSLCPVGWSSSLPLLVCLVVDDIRKYMEGPLYAVILSVRILFIICSTASSHYRQMRALLLDWSQLANTYVVRWIISLTLRTARTSGGWSGSSSIRCRMMGCFEVAHLPQAGLAKTLTSSQFFDELVVTFCLLF